MSNVLNGLIAKIDDPLLRAEISREVGLIRDNKRFGLVFERHLPEVAKLHSHPVRRGCSVQHRVQGESPDGMVTAVTSGMATVAWEDGSTEEAPTDQLVVVARFGEPVFPGLTSLGRIERGGDKPFHAVIKSDNFHALQLLSYTHTGRVDAIYIDPPYNTGARDWKYNNDYVDDTDAFRHSKWLSFMEKRLLLARTLLRPDDSMLFITIDDHELATLNLLLDQIFPNNERQIASITISPRGKSRVGRLAQVDEYLVIVFVGTAVAASLPANGEAKEIRWRYLRRNDEESARTTRPRQFYPIYVNTSSHRIEKVGEPLEHDDPLDAAPTVEGTVAVFPIRDDGFQLNWGLTGPSLKKALDEGYVRVSQSDNPHCPYTIAYLTRPNIKKVEKGELQVTGRREDGSRIVVIPGGKPERPTTAWRDSRYDAGAYGTSLVRSLLPGRKFPFPKSLYAVEDTLRLAVGEKKDAIVLDFFAGSGTTAHAVSRLNRDGGRRSCILVTNNEVSIEEAAKLSARGHHPGDPEWEAFGIFEHITRPRLEAAITGRTPMGDGAEGSYKFYDEFPLAEGFRENIEFFELTYLDPNRVARGRAFTQVAPLLWLQAGATGPCIAEVSDTYAAPDGATYSVLFDPAYIRELVQALDGRDDVVRAFIVTNSTAAYQQAAAELPSYIEPSMLYEDYLHNFQINRASTGSTTTGEDQ